MPRSPHPARTPGDDGPDPTPGAPPGSSGSEPPGRRRSGRGRRVLVAVGAFLLAVTFVPTLGCGDDDDERTPTTEPRSTSTSERASSTSTTTTAPPTPEEAAEAALLQAYEDLYAAAATADPDDPRLAETRSGPNLDLVRELLTERQRAGEIATFVDGQPPVPAITAVQVQDADTVLVTFCIVDNVRMVRAADESVVDDDVVSRLSRAEMVRTESDWRLETQDDLESWDDGEGCDR